jgi:hypothetical protein
MDNPKQQRGCENRLCGSRIWNNPPTQTVTNDVTRQHQDDKNRRRSHIHECGETAGIREARQRAFVAVSPR